MLSSLEAMAVGRSARKNLINEIHSQWLSIKENFYFCICAEVKYFFGVIQLGWSNNFAKRKSKQLQYLYHLNLRQQVAIEKIFVKSDNCQKRMGLELNFKILYSGFQFSPKNISKL